MWFLPHPVLFLEVVGDFLFTNHIDKVDDRRSPLHEYKRDETVSVTEAGVITGLKAGNTTVTATYEGLQDTINVTVGA